MGRRERASEEKATDWPSRRRRFDTLYDAHVDALLRYAVGRVERVEDAADVVADTMLVAWRRLEVVPAGHEARYWLVGVARRVLANHRRSTGRRQRLGHQLRQELRRSVGPDHADRIDTARVVAVAMEQLTEHERELLRLTTWEGLGSNEMRWSCSFRPPRCAARSIGPGPGCAASSRPTASHLRNPTPPADTARTTDERRRPRPAGGPDLPHG